VKDIVHLEVRAYPGLDLSAAFLKLVSLEVDCRGLDGVIISLGSNDITKGDKFDIARKMGAIVTYLRHAFPKLKIAITTIIPRPADNGANQLKRLNVNLLFQRLCKSFRIVCMKTWKAVMTSNALDMKYYAFDKIHLNRRGVISMRRYLKGATGALLTSRSRK
jgi:lysophospholipase L1-like esterase